MANRSQAQPEKIQIGFIGKSGIGKSSVIKAFLEDQAYLPDQNSRLPPTTAPDLHQTKLQPSNHDVHILDFTGSDSFTHLNLSYFPQLDFIYLCVSAGELEKNLDTLEPYVREKMKNIKEKMNRLANKPVVCFMVTQADNVKTDEKAEVKAADNVKTDEKAEVKAADDENKGVRELLVSWWKNRKPPSKDVIATVEVAVPVQEKPRLTSPSTEAMNFLSRLMDAAKEEAGEEAEQELVVSDTIHITSAACWTPHMGDKIRQQLETKVPKPDPESSFFSIRQTTSVPNHKLFKTTFLAGSFFSVASATTGIASSAFHATSASQIILGLTCASTTLGVAAAVCILAALWMIYHQQSPSDEATTSAKLLPQPC